jgi:hypothetical protein
MREGPNAQSSIVSVNHKFEDAVVVGNMVIFAPKNADGVGLFHVDTRTFELIDISNIINRDWKFCGAVAVRWATRSYLRR